MNDPWKNFSRLWWPSSVGANVGLPAASAQPPDAPWTDAWPAMAAQRPWTPPIPSAPSQGGLLGSLNAPASGGILGQLAPPTPSLMSMGPIPGSYYFPPAPPAPGSDAIPPRASAGAAEPFPQPPSPTSWNAPAGRPDSGQSTSGVSGAQNDPRILSDVTPDNYWIPGANYADDHHEFPQAHYKKMPLETRKVFNRATVGELFLRMDGRRHEYDAFHRVYNTATGELLKKFMEENNIAGQPEKMTPGHADAVLKAIAESEDPRIRDYREFVRRLRMFYRFRIGRGTE